MDTIKCEACNREFGSQEALSTHNYAKHNIPLNSKKEEKKKISKTAIFFIIVILAVLIVGYFFIHARSSTGNVVGGDVQRITLSYKNGNYYPNTITVNAGEPVEITLDGSIGGCYRSFNIKSLGVSEYSASPSDTIKFTPDQKGSFEFACGMRMGRGTIKVE